MTTEHDAKVTGIKIRKFVIAIVSTFDDKGKATPASARPIERWPGQTPDGERALRFLNKARAIRGRRDLCPIVAGYTDDDIIADARHYGWEG